VENQTDIDARKLKIREILGRVQTRLTGQQQHSEPEKRRRLPDGYEHADWSQVWQRERMRSEILRVHEAKRWPLYLHGPTGTGKTTLAALIYEGWDRVPMWYRADDYLIDFADRDGRAKMREKVAATPCLFLDDLGVRPPTPPMMQALFDTLEIRARKPIVIVSNLNAQQLSNVYDERIVSRIVAGTTIAIVSDDRRAKQGRHIQVRGEN
jgi:chromosomal replication initiation ATPase DnaA